MKKLLVPLAIALSCCLSAHAIKTSELKWTPMENFPVHGTLAGDGNNIRYTRLPQAMADTVRADLADLGTNTAGMYIRFASDASAIGARWKATKKFNMNHMTAAGIRGLDLYTRLDDGTWTTVSSARPSFGSHNTTTMVITDMKPQMREYMLYLPLYDGVDSIFIGTDSTATVIQPRVDSPRRGHPLVMYGTSILQGGCASRPGMVHTSILGRMLDREVVNLGFSGNARLDPGMAMLIADSDASVIVLDPLPNVKTEELKARMPEFLRIIRAKHPHTPVVLVESAIFPVMRFNEETLETIGKKNEALREIYDEAVSGGDTNLYYFEGKDCLGDQVEGTVDNYHFTDLGFSVFAQNMYPLLKTLLEQSDARKGF